MTSSERYDLHNYRNTAEGLELSDSVGGIINDLLFPRAGVTTNRDTAFNNITNILTDGGLEGLAANDFVLNELERRAGSEIMNLPDVGHLISRTYETFVPKELQNKLEGSNGYMSQGVKLALFAAQMNGTLTEAQAQIGSNVVTAFGPGANQIDLTSNSDMGIVQRMFTDPMHYNAAVYGSPLTSTSANQDVVSNYLKNELGQSEAQINEYYESQGLDPQYAETDAGVLKSIAGFAKAIGSGTVKTLKDINFQYKKYLGGDIAQNAIKLGIQSSSLGAVSVGGMAIPVAFFLYPMIKKLSDTLSPKDGQEVRDYLAQDKFLGLMDGIPEGQEITLQDLTILSGDVPDPVEGAANILDLAANPIKLVENLYDNVITPIPIVGDFLANPFGVFGPEDRQNPTPEEQAALNELYTQAAYNGLAEDVLNATPEQLQEYLDRTSQYPEQSYEELANKTDNYYDEKFPEVLNDQGFPTRVNGGNTNAGELYNADGSVYDGSMFDDDGNMLPPTQGLTRDEYLQSVYDAGDNFTNAANNLFPGGSVDITGEGGDNDINYDPSDYDPTALEELNQRENSIQDRRDAINLDQSMNFFDELDELLEDVTDQEGYDAAFNSLSEKYAQRHAELDAEQEEVDSLRGDIYNNEVETGQRNPDGTPYNPSEPYEGPSQSDIDSMMADAQAGEESQQGNGAWNNGGEGVSQDWLDSMGIDLTPAEWAEMEAENAAAAAADFGSNIVDDGSGPRNEDGTPYNPFESPEERAARLEREGMAQAMKDYSPDGEGDYGGPSQSDIDAMLAADAVEAARAEGFSQSQIDEMLPGESVDDYYLRTYRQGEDEDPGNYGPVGPGLNDDNTWTPAYGDEWSEETPNRVTMYDSDGQPYTAYANEDGARAQAGYEQGGTFDQDGNYTEPNYNGGVTNTQSNEPGSGFTNNPGPTETELRQQDNRDSSTNASNSDVANARRAREAAEDAQNNNNNNSGGGGGGGGTTSTAGSQKEGGSGGTTPTGYGTTPTGYGKYDYFHMGSQPLDEEIFNEADQDGDGSITFDNFKQRYGVGGNIHSSLIGEVQGQFDAVDANGDGIVTRGELNGNNNSQSTTNTLVPTNGSNNSQSNMNTLVPTNGTTNNDYQSSGDLVPTSSGGSSSNRMLEYDENGNLVEPNLSGVQNTNTGLPYQGNNQTAIDLYNQQREMTIENTLRQEFQRLAATGMGAQAAYDQVYGSVNEPELDPGAEDVTDVLPQGYGNGFKGGDSLYIPPGMTIEEVREQRIAEIESLPERLAPGEFGTYYDADRDEIIAVDPPRPVETGPPEGDVRPVEPTPVTPGSDGNPFGTGPGTSSLEPTEQTVQDIINVSYDPNFIDQVISNANPENIPNGVIAPDGPMGFGTPEYHYNPETGETFIAPSDRYTFEEGSGWISGTKQQYETSQGNYPEGVTRRTDTGPNGEPQQFPQETVDYYNSITGESFTAPDGGFSADPDAGWFRGTRGDYNRSIAVPDPNNPFDTPDGGINQLNPIMGTTTDTGTDTMGSVVQGGSPDPASITDFAGMANNANLIGAGIPTGPGAVNPGLIGGGTPVGPNITDLDPSSRTITTGAGAVNPNPDANLPIGGLPIIGAGPNPGVSDTTVAPGTPGYNENNLGLEDRFTTGGTNPGATSGEVQYGDEFDPTFGLLRVLYGDEVANRYRGGGLAQVDAQNLIDKYQRQVEGLAFDRTATLAGQDQELVNQLRQTQRDSDLGLLQNYGPSYAQALYNTDQVATNQLRQQNTMSNRLYDEAEGNFSDSRQAQITEDAFQTSALQGRERDPSMLYERLIGSEQARADREARAQVAGGNTFNMSRNFTQQIPGMILGGGYDASGNKTISPVYGAVDAVGAAQQNYSNTQNFLDNQRAQQAYQESINAAREANELSTLEKLENGFNTFKDGLQTASDAFTFIGGLGDSFQGIADSASGSSLPGAGVVSSVAGAAGGLLTGVGNLFGQDDTANTATQPVNTATQAVNTATQPVNTATTPANTSTFNTTPLPATTYDTSSTFNVDSFGTGLDLLQTGAGLFGGNVDTSGTGINYGENVIPSNPFATDTYGNITSGGGNPFATDLSGNLTNAGGNGLNQPYVTTPANTGSSGGGALSGLATLGSGALGLGADALGGAYNLGSDALGSAYGVGSNVVGGVVDVGADLLGAGYDVTSNVVETAVDVGSKVVEFTVDSIATIWGGLFG